MLPLGTICKTRAKEIDVRPLWSRCGDRELFWILIGCVLLLVFGLNTFAGAAPLDLITSTNAGTF